MICLSSRDMPSPPKGWSFWLQVRDGGTWSTVCCLRLTDAWDVLRWLDRHPLRRELRVLAEKI